MKRIGVFALVSLAMFGMAFEASADETIDLSGKQLFKEGDNTTWAAPDFDDSTWRRVDVPAEWSDIGVSLFENYGWYRIRFEIPPELRGKALAVELGAVLSMDQTFLNGVEIGQSGSFGAYSVDPLVITRVYHLPRELVNADGVNVLAIRVMRVPSVLGGIVGGKQHIGEVEDIVIPAEQRIHRVELFEGVFLGAIALLWVISALMVRGRSREYQALLIFLTLFFLTCLVETSLLYRAGLKTPAVQWFGYFVGILLPAAFLHFVGQVAIEPSRSVRITIFSLSGALAIGAMFPFNDVWIAVVGFAWIAVLLATCVLSVFYLFKAYRHRREYSRPMMIGIGLFCASLLPDFLALDLFWKATGVASTYVGAVILAIAAVYALARQMLGLEQQLRKASLDTLRAQEKERHRLSMDLHDGLGQSLATLKLNLQLSSAIGGDGDSARQLSESAKQVQEMLEDLRRVALDLHPSALTDKSLAGAIADFGDSAGQQLGVEVRVRVAPGLEVDPDTAAHLYRIFQETFNNASRHGKAGVVNVEIEQEDDLVRMKIKDDGTGFDEASVQAGLGLKTVRQRADLLGGSCRITSDSGEGTLVEVEVPKCQFAS